MNAPVSRFKALLGGRDTLRGQLSLGVASSLGLKVTYMVLTLGLTVVLARILGPEGFGVYAYALSLVTLIAVPTQMGLPTLVVREVARYQVQERWGLLKGLLQRVNQVVVVTSLIIGVGAALIAWAVADTVSEEQVRTFAWALLLLPLIALGNLRGAALRGLRKIVQGQLPEYLLRPGLHLVFIGAAVLVWGSTLSASSAMMYHAMASFVAFGVGAFLLMRELPKASKAAAAEYEMKAWARSVVPLSFIAGITIVNSQADIVMLGIWKPAEDVGLYRVAVQGASLVTFGLGAVNLAIAPYLSRLYHSGERGNLQRIVTLTSRSVFLLAVPVTLAFLFFGDLVLSLAFGTAFAAAHYALAILCVGELVNASTGSVGYLLNMAGYEGRTARGLALAAGTNIVVNLLLIPPYGIEGAAIASAVSLVVWNVYLVRQARLYTGIATMAFSLRKPAVRA